MPCLQFCWVLIACLGAARIGGVGIVPPILSTLERRRFSVNRTGMDHMFKSLFAVCLAACLVLGLNVSARAAPFHLAGPVHLANVAITPVASVSIDTGDEFTHFGTPRLVLLGVGIVAGAVLLPPVLQINELFGGVLGAIGAEVLYHAGYRLSGIGS